MPTRDEVEVSLKDSISAALRKIGGHLDEINVKAKEASAAGGPDVVADETVRLGGKVNRANRALGGGGASLGSSGSLGAVLSAFSAVLGPPALLAGAFLAAAKSLETFAGSRVRLQAFATDSSLTATNVQDLRQALSMLGRTGGEQDSIIAKLSSRFQELQTFGLGRGAGRLASMFAERPGGTEMLQDWQRLMRENPDNLMPVYIDLLKKFRQASPSDQNFLAMAFDLDKSLLGELLDALAEVAPEARADAELMRAHLLRMIKIRAEWDAEWTKVKMLAVDIGVQIGAALEKEGFSFEGMRTQIKQAFDSINYEMVATALIAIGKDMETASTEISYIIESTSPIIDLIKKYSPIQISMLTPEEQKQLEQEYARSEKLRIDKNSAAETAKVLINLKSVLLGEGPGGAGGVGGGRGGRLGPTFRRGVGPGSRESAGPSRPISIEGATAEEKNTLALIEKYESRGQNIMNYVGRAQGLDPTTPKGYTAQGYFQILNSNWAKYAPALGIKAPNAMAASREDQARVALALMRDTGIGNWTRYNAPLRAALARGERAVYGTEGGAGGGIAGIDTSQRVIEAQSRLAGIRKGALDPRMRAVLDYAAEKTGLTAEVFSGGEGMPGAPGYASASGRHIRGRAADFKLFDKDGRPVPISDPRAAAFIEHAFSVGARSGGAAGHYMGNYSIDLGLTGSGGLYYGSQELREAAQRGFAASGDVIEQRLRDEAARRGAGVKAEVNFRNVPAGVKTSVEGKGDGIRELTQSRSNHFSEHMPADL